MDTIRNLLYIGDQTDKSFSLDWLDVQYICIFPVIIQITA